MCFIFIILFLNFPVLFWFLFFYFFFFFFANFVILPLGPIWYFVVHRELFLCQKIKKKYLDIESHEDGIACKDIAAHGASTRWESCDRWLVSCSSTIDQKCVLQTSSFFHTGLVSWLCDSSRPWGSIYIFSVVLGHWDLARHLTWYEQQYCYTTWAYHASQSGLSL